VECGGHNACFGKDTEFIEDSKIKVFKLDVTNPEQAKTATARAIAEFGRIDVVVNNVGFGVYGPLEFAEDSTIDGQFAVQRSRAY